MRTISGVPERDYQQIRFLATTLNLTDGEVVGFLLRRLAELSAHDGNAAPRQPISRQTDIHVVYEGKRVEATFDRETEAVTVSTGSLGGQRFRSPSGAAIAVVQELNPTVSPNRNGWTFWVVTATGRPLESIRYKA